MTKYLFAIIFSFLGAKASCQVTYRAEEAGKHIGDSVTICGRIFTANYLESSVTKPTLLNMGGVFPNHQLTIMIADADRQNFPVRPEQLYPKKFVCVTGKVIDFKGKPEIIITNPSQILVSADSVQQSPVLVPPVVKKVDTVKAPTPTVIKKDTVKQATLPVEDKNSYSIKITNEVNLRAEPKATAQVLLVVKPGTSVKIYKSENGWSQVSVEKAVAGQEKKEIVVGYIKNNVLQ